MRKAMFNKNQKRTQRITLGLVVIMIGLLGFAACASAVTLSGTIVKPSVTPTTTISPSIIKVTTPAAPSNLKTTSVSTSQIDLAWTDNSSNEDAFAIERSTSQTGPFSVIATVSADMTDYSSTGLSPGTAYTYRVQAVGSTGLKSAYSNTATSTTKSVLVLSPTITGPATINQNLIKTPIKCAAPTSLAATAVSATKIKLTWKDNSTNENGYRIERKTGTTGTYAKIADIAANAATYENSPVTTGTTYYYRVQALGNGSTTLNSDYSNEASGKTAFSKIVSPGGGVTPGGSASTDPTSTDPSSTDPGYTDPSYTDPGYVEPIPEQPYLEPTDPNAATGGTAGPIVMQFTIGSKEYYINGSPQAMDVGPMIKEGRTLMPVRYLGTPLGADIGWDGTAKKATVSLNGQSLELWVGKGNASLNGNPLPIDANNPNVVPIIVQGRTMLPMRFIAETLGCTVDWDSIAKQATISYGL